MHLVFNNFLNQIRKSSTGNFTVVKSEETIVIITFADLCIVFSFLMYCIQKFIKIHSINYLPSVYYMPGTALNTWNTRVSRTKMPGLMELICVIHTLKVSNHLIYLFFHSSLHSNSELITELLPHCNLYYFQCCLKFAHLSKLHYINVVLLQLILFN